VRTSLFFVIRKTLAWILAYLGALIVWTGVLDQRGPGPLLVLVALMWLGFVVAGAISHARRVRLVAGHVDATTLAIRQRRQIEIPLDADEAFALVDATIRELPQLEGVESVRDSLQVRARLGRINPHGAMAQWWVPSPFWRYIDPYVTRNLVTATIVPEDGASSVTLLCEPESGAWSDWFRVDEGTNLENAEAITRAISRRLAERRRSERAAAQQTVTEKELTVAKLSLLHAQVEPHFLYNTLASAQYLTRSDPARADQMLGNLITYLRHSLPRSEDPSSTLGDELERARSYLEILGIRMGPRLAFQVEVPDALTSLPFPTMMLQTLVENAIKHGLEPKPGGGTIWIIARRVDDSLAVTVADDGHGFDEGSSGTGIGLKNVRERLRLAFGTEASFSIVANYPSGVAATINVPVASAQGHCSD